MSYTVNKSDISKTPISVPDTSPYANVTDTSLTLVGKGNPNYGAKIAENFVHLLENFADTTAPSNPIEGQLWYDTSVPTNKLLKVYNNSTWVPTNGIHKAEDKSTIVGIVSAGDIYVHPRGLDQVCLWDGDDWIPLGPAIATGTKNGIFSETWDKADGTGQSIVVAAYINDEVITVIASETFIPNPVRTGFGQLTPGLNVSTQVFAGTKSRVSGLAESALALQLTNEPSPISADSFLRNDQTGVVQGFLSVSGIRVGSITPTVFLERSSNNVALLTNRTNAASIGLSVLKDGIINQILTVDGNNLRVGIGAGNLTPSKTLDVLGTAVISGLTQIGDTGTNSLEVLGHATVGGNFTATGSLRVSSSILVGDVSGNGTAILPGAASVYDLGSSDTPFRTVFANSFANTSTMYSYVATGMIMPYAGNGIPEGWLECAYTSGSPVALDATTGTTFTRLYQAIGITFGGTGPTDFQLPQVDNTIYGPTFKVLIKL